MHLSSISLLFKLGGCILLFNMIACLTVSFVTHILVIGYSIYGRVSVSKMDGVFVQDKNKSRGNPVPP